jgi:hypothetical protein
MPLAVNPEDRIKDFGWGKQWEGLPHNLTLDKPKKL